MTIKRTLILFLYITGMPLLASCQHSKQMRETAADTLRSNQMKFRITIGTTSFHATLSDNPAARAFAAKLPMSLKLKDLNGNEKFVNLPYQLPVHASIPETIQTGDLMLYNSNTLVIFYKSFQTSYAYTRLGKIANVEGLAEAVGNRDVTVHMALADE